MCSSCTCTSCNTGSPEVTCKLDRQPCNNRPNTTTVIRKRFNGEKYIVNQLKWVKCPQQCIAARHSHARYRRPTWHSTASCKIIVDHAIDSPQRLFCIITQKRWWHNAHAQMETKSINISPTQQSHHSTKKIAPPHGAQNQSAS